MSQLNLSNVLNQFRLDGRTALVTGGSQGLGRIISETLAQAGANIVVVSRSLDKCQVAAEEIGTATSVRTLALNADVTKAEDIARLAESVEQKMGTVDILINCAGLNIRGPVSELTEKDWDDVLTINLKSPFLMSKEFGPKMVKRGWGRIVNLGSILSSIGIANRTPYASSKAGVLGLTRTLAMEFAPHGVTVNALCPGPFATEMNRPLLNDPAQYQAFVAKIPMGRWGELDEIRGAALFLASNASSYMTGNTLYVDGGWTAQ